MKNFLGSILAVLLFCSTALCGTDFAVPKQTIQGADLTVTLGEIVTLNVSPIQNPAKGFVSASYHWKIYDGQKEKPFKDLPDGSVIFGTGTENKTFRVLVSAVYLYTLTEGDKVTEVGVRQQWLESKVTVGKGNPGPNPPPSPDVVPVFVPSKYNLEMLSYNSGLKIDKEVREKSVKQLSDSFKDLSLNKTGNIQDFLKRVKETNSKLLTTLGVYKEWESFGNDIENVMFKLYEDRKAVTVEDFAEAYSEISVGLSKVK